MDDLLRQAQEFWNGLDQDQQKKVAVGGLVGLVLLSQGGARLVRFFFTFISFFSFFPLEFN